MEFKIFLKKISFFYVILSDYFNAKKTKQIGACYNGVVISLVPIMLIRENYFNFIFLNFMRCYRELYCKGKCGI